MIIQRNVPFDRMARFLLDNVCEMPQDSVPGHIREGFADYLALITEIYEDVESFETENIEASYLSLLNTLKFLYGCFTVGVEKSRNGNPELVVSKSELNKVYKKGKVTSIVQGLRRYGVDTKYSRSGEACGSLGASTDLVITSTRNPDLIPAARSFAGEIATVSGREGDYICDCPAIFVKGDYASAAGLRPLSRATLDPMRSDILRTVGRHRRAWAEMVEVMAGEAGWAASGFMHYHVSPSWGVSFAEKGKRPTAIFTLASERVFIEFTLPVESAEEIIRNRGGLADSVLNRIEAFKCLACPKRCGGKSLSVVDGVALCTGRAEARRIYMILETPSEFSSIRSMVETITRSN